MCWQSLCTCAVFILLGYFKMQGCSQQFQLEGELRQCFAGPAFSVSTCEAVSCSVGKSGEDLEMEEVSCNYAQNEVFNWIDPLPWIHNNLILLLKWLVSTNYSIWFFSLPFEAILKSNGINYHKNAEEMESKAIKTNWELRRWKHLNAANTRRRPTTCEEPAHPLRTAVYTMLGGIAFYSTIPTVIVWL